MALQARKPWIRWTAVFLTLAALVPALHDALSHCALTPGELAAVAAPLHDTGDLASETCPICLASKQGSAVLTLNRAHCARVVATIARLAAAPLVRSGAIVGAASPRAPPSA